MKRPLDPRVPEDEAALFRAAMRDAVPLRAPARHERAQPAHPPVPIQSLLDEHAALDESRTGALDDDSALETGEEIAYVRAGVARQVLRRLRRGHWVVQGHLDLHGMNRAEAHAALAAFLSHAVRHARRCVRIVHGKGLGSKNREPVLKGKVRVWLARREDVLAFCQAPAAQGGGGAVLVLLKA
ncbi:MAG TPA: Smr/MutS family protein [Burkholderiales bacterium]|nr:Smr/MutS family protein [Burkholderiales bacterium]